MNLFAEMVIKSEERNSCPRAGFLVFTTERQLLSAPVGGTQEQKPPKYFAVLL